MNIYIIIAIALVLWVIFKRPLGTLLNIPKLTIVRAKIAAKEQQKPISSYYPFSHYIITFEIEDGRAVCFSVPGVVYESFSVGSKGTLAYAGKRFRKFKIDSD